MGWDGSQHRNAKPPKLNRSDMKSTFRILAIAASLATAGLPLLRADDAATSAPTETKPAGPDAGRHQGMRRDPMERLHRLAEALNLTQAQKDQIKAIITGNEPQRQAIMEDTALSPDQKRAKMRELMQATEPKIRALLTPEQQVKFDALPKGPGHRGPGHREPPPPPPSGDAPPPPPPPEGGNS
jgi:Spy/CpxP family protein refolding chaperone